MVGEEKAKPRSLSSAPWEAWVHILLNHSSTGWPRANGCPCLPLSFSSVKWVM